MDSGDNRPWMAYQDVVNDLVQPPLKDLTKTITTGLGEVIESVENLRVEQRGAAERQHELVSLVVARVDAVTEMIRKLHVEQQEAVERLTDRIELLEANSRDQFGVLIEDDRTRVQMFNRLLMRVDAEGATYREVHKIADQIRREQSQAHQQALNLEKHLVERLPSGRSRSNWTIGTLTVFILLLVVVDLIIKFA
jgi:hypothetical protein